MRIAKVSRAGLALLLGCVLMMVALVVPGLQANAAPVNNQVCSGLDSGKIDVSGDHTSVTVTAPTGYLIDEYCVKAGSTQNGNGPVYVTVNPPQKSVTITYPGGKAISHYSVSYVPVTPPPSTTTTHTTPPPSTTTKHTTPPPSTTTHTSPPVTTTSTSPASTTTSSAAPVSTATTYPLQPVNAGATSDNAVAPSATNRVTVIGLALLVLLAVFGGRRLLQMRFDRPESRRE